MPLLLMSRGPLPQPQKGGASGRPGERGRRQEFSRPRKVSQLGFPKESPPRLLSVRETECVLRIAWCSPTPQCAAVDVIRSDDDRTDPKEQAGITDLYDLVTAVTRPLLPHLPVRNESPSPAYTQGERELGSMFREKIVEERVDSFQLLPFHFLNLVISLDRVLYHIHT